MFVSNNMKPNSIEDYFQQKVLCIPNYLKTAKILQFDVFMLEW